MNARREFLCRLLVELLTEIPESRRDYAGNIIVCCAEAMDALALEEHTAGFTAGVEAANAVIQPNVELADLRRRRDEHLGAMLQAFCAMKSATSH